MFRFVTTVIFDLDGTIYCGESPVPEAVETIAKMREYGLQILFLTNNSVKTRSEIQKKLHKMGICCTTEEIMTSGYMAVLFAQQNRLKNIYICGSDALREEFREAGLFPVPPEKAEQLVIGFDNNFSYAKLAAALPAAIKAKYIVVCNRERYFPGEKGKLLPGCGAIAASLEFSSNRTADVVVGKPDPQMLQVLCLQYNLKPSQLLMVGDTYESDIVMAKTFGCHTAYFHIECDASKEFPADIHLNRLSQLCTLFSQFKDKVKSNANN